MLPIGDAHAGAPPHFVVDAVAMVGNAALASTSQSGLVRETAAVTSPSMLTHDLGAGTATPLDQVAVIPPYGDVDSSFEPQGAMRGAIVNRGRTIPVLCLARLTGGLPAVATVRASVLVVESDGDLIGLLVPGLKVIEPVRWQPHVKPLAGQGAKGTARRG